MTTQIDIKKKLDHGNNDDNRIIQRTDEINILASFIQSLTNSHVIAIDAPWGYGKTSFIQQLENHLQKTNTNTIMINVWEQDFIDDPMDLLLGELYSTLKKDDKAFDTILDYAAKLGKISLPVLVKTLISLLAKSTGLPIDGGDLASLAEDEVKSKIKEHEDQKKSIQHFKDELTNYIKNNTNGKLVVIIDELDRCRPDFAVKLLERIKHLFSLENILFIMSVDKKQLGQALTPIYGFNVDQEGYLKRFFDTTYHLKSLNTNKFETALFHLYEIEKNAKNKNLRNDYIQTIRKTYQICFDGFEMSARDMKQAYAFFYYTLMTDAQTMLHGTILFPFMCCLKIRHPDIYIDYIKTPGSGEKLVKKLLSENLFKNTKDKRLNTTLKVIIIRGRMDVNEFTGYTNGLRSAINTGNPEVNTDEAKALVEYIDSFTNISGYDYDQASLRIASQIDMVDRFE